MKFLKVFILINQITLFSLINSADYTFTSVDINKCIAELKPGWARKRLPDLVGKTEKQATDYVAKNIPGGWQSTVLDCLKKIKSSQSKFALSQKSKTTPAEPKKLQKDPTAQDVQPISQQQTKELKKLDPKKNLGLEDPTNKELKHIIN